MIKKILKKRIVKKFKEKLLIWSVVIFILAIFFSKYYLYFFIFWLILLIRFLIKEFYSSSLLPEYKEIKLFDFEVFSYSYYFDYTGVDENKLKFDKKYGISVFDYGDSIGLRVTPTHTATVSLVYLQKYLRTRNNSYFYAYKNHIEWIKNKYIDLEYRGLVWCFDFDWKEYKSVLRAPWFSALSQGLIISALIRNYLIFGDEESLKIAKKATKIFEFDVPFGVRYIDNGYFLYEEYPTIPPVHILDGFLFSLLGLYDIMVVTCEERERYLFWKGINGLKYKLPFYDYKGKWSIFGKHDKLSSFHYNLMNVKLLEIIYKITKDDLFLKYSKLWSPYNKKFLDKLEISFLVRSGIKVR